jgi:hypothetical protein
MISALEPLRAPPSSWTFYYSRDPNSLGRQREAGHPQAKAGKTFSPTWHLQGIGTSMRNASLADSAQSCDAGLPT